ncbi:sugar phosphate isomerase/epimerase [Bacteroides sp. 519]|uniref:sugar phosphate isomerase/epimerase family protein n=1 Tax=Bacteroides sp. 519 TaxID=2302937 RepID=UPI0013D2C41A|nr:sugar phosphate isomerase/epimerase [Bacteroides sp. 519]NDV58596.1 sugar phosphate isomerase/epimerase [Bacteroides sp. 519]
MKKLLLFAALPLFMASCNAPKTEQAQPIEPVKKDIAVQLYSLLRHGVSDDYDGTIKKVGEMGFTSVEAAGYGDGKFYGKTPEAFKADLEAVGVYALSSHTGRGLSADELKSKKYSDETTAWWDQCIAAHKAAGMKYIVTPSMEVPKTIEDLQTYCEYYNEIGRKCKENGMKFGYHNHAFEFVKIKNGENEVVMYDYMIQNTDPALVLFEMDVYWVVRGAASPVDYFNKYPGRFEVLHVKDNKELGQSGMVGFDAIFKNTDTAGVKHLIIEVEKYNFEPTESVKKSLEYLQNCSLVKESYI